MSTPIAAILVAALVLGACGGGDDKTAKIESKADFVAAGDAICVERDARSAKLKTTIGDDGDVARLTGELADIYADTIQRLRALDLPPGADRGAAQKYVASVEAMRKPVDRMKASADDLAVAVRSKQAEALKRSAEQLQINVNAVQAIGDQADQRAREYGFRKCGQQTADPIS